MKSVCQNYVVCLRRGIEYVHWITETEKEMILLGQGECQKIVALPQKYSIFFED
jgi:hypothetical protein